MSRYYSYLQSAISILQQYSGEQPFALFIKEYFRMHKKHGSRDRKMISQLCYGYFRLGKAASNLQMDEKIILGWFLSSEGPHDFLEATNPGLNKIAGQALKEKLQIVQDQLNPAEIFPWQDALSQGIDHLQFSTSHLVQPDLYLRVRPGHEARVLSQLKNAGIPFRALHEHCIAVPNTSRLNEIVSIDKEVVVQDLNSQQVASLIQAAARKEGSDDYLVWDCCAASGGKSILAVDSLPNIKLTVSDIRPQIIANLKKRFALAGIHAYQAHVMDLARQPVQDTSPVAGKLFDLVICDAPCTGSGTWGRTPEQLFYFDVKKIEHYTSLQKKITLNASRYLEPGGHLLYITCSVFKKENEDLVSWLQNETGLQIAAQQLFKGYDQKADTLFAALLKKQV